MQPLRPPLYPTAPLGSVPPPYPGAPGTGYPPGTTAFGRPVVIGNVRQGAVPQKDTTLWVGKIASTIDPLLIRRVLECCGTLREWKPATDVKTGVMKGFGFATYQQAEGVLMALELLNGLVLDGQALALKCNSATEAYINWYRSSREKAGNNNEDFTRAVEGARKTLEELVGNRMSAVQSTDAAEAASEFLSTLGVNEAMPPPVDEPIKQRGAIRASEPSRDVERMRHREEQQRHRDDARAYRELLRRWEDHEREIRRLSELAHDRERDLRKERWRQVVADNEGLDSDDEEDVWGRKPYLYSRKASERKRRRELERQEEIADCERERREAEANEFARVQEARKMSADLQREEQHDEDLHLATQRAPMEVAASRPQKKARAGTVFVEEDTEEHAEGIRRLIPIKYSAEEMQAIPKDSGDGEKRQQGAPGPEDLRKRLLALVPKDKAGVFAYQVKWDMLDRAPQEMKTRLAAWVTKKIQDLVGVDAQAQGFADFIVEEIHKHTSAEGLLESISDVLDEDAEPFILQLFKLLIFQTEELAAA